jgi:hypothetical protein
LVNFFIIIIIKVRGWDDPLLVADAKTSPFYYRFCMKRLFQRIQ